MKKNKEFRTMNAGGSALNNGIIFSTKYRKVFITHEKIEGNKKRYRCRTTENNPKRPFITYIPIIRGIASIFAQVGESKDELLLSTVGETSKNNTIILIYSIFAIFAIGIPMLFSGLVPEAYRSLFQAAGIFSELLLVIAFIRSMPVLSEVYKYHGAEHKAINAYLRHKRGNLTLEEIKKESRIHKCCGGNLIVYIIFLVMLSCFLPIQDQAIKFLVILALLIPNIGIAFEIVDILAILPRPLDILGLPACIIQLATTQEPTEDMLKLARYGINAAVREQNGITVQEYANRYIKSLDEEKAKDADINDIYLIIEYGLQRDLNDIKMNKDTMLISLSKEILIDSYLDTYYYTSKPLQYITNTQYFFNEKYYVDENVLIPRSDSEILVEKALEYINNEEENINKVIDLCTGSGCLGISIAKNAKKDIDMTLIDISKGAIEVANKNIVNNGVEDKVKVIESDLLKVKIDEVYRSSNKEETKVDMIVSNPPYIQTEVCKTLDKRVKKEPILALDGGQDGMDFYKRIVKEAKNVLKNNGLLIFEIGYDELDLIKKLIQENKEYTMLESVKDYGGNDRVVICRFQHK